MNWSDILSTLTVYSLGQQAFDSIEAHVAASNDSEEDAKICPELTEKGFLLHFTSLEGADLALGLYESRGSIFYIARGPRGSWRAIVDTNRQEMARHYYDSVVNHLLAQ